jgi:hypothetical protein
MRWGIQWMDLELWAKKVSEKELQPRVDQKYIHWD